MTARARWRDRPVHRTPNPREVAARAARIVDTDRSLRARLNLGLSLLSWRKFCPTCQAHVDQARRALAGASIDQLTHYEDTS